MGEFLNVNREAVLKIFNKTDASVQNDLQILREWLKHQPHLPKIDDGLLERLLLFTKFSIERTKERVNAYYTVRSQVPEFFDNWDSTSDELNSFKTLKWIPLKDQTDQFQRVFISKGFTDDPKDIDITVDVKYNFLALSILLQVEYSNGAHFIYDLSNWQLAHLALFTPALMSKVNKVYMQAYDIRTAGVHIIFPPTFVDALVSLIKSLVKEKLVSRIHVHKDLESLYKFVPKRILPTQYGGDAGDLDNLHSEWVKYIGTWRPWLLNESKVRVDESKRPKTSKTENILGSIPGTFKKLDID